MKRTRVEKANLYIRIYIMIHINEEKGKNIDGRGMW